MTGIDSATIWIRPMCEADVAVVARLRCAAFFAGTERTEEIDAAGLRALINGDGYETALVAECDGAVVGTGLLVRNELDAAHDVTPWLAGLVVDPDHRRRGVGADLVQAIEAHAWRLGVRALHLYTDTAEDFYAALGWSVADRFLEDGESMALMVRLPPP